MSTVGARIRLDQGNMKVLGDLARKGRWVVLINFDSHVINILHF